MEAYNLASRVSHKEKVRGKALYDRKVYGAELFPGNRVLVCNFKEKGGPGKLRPQSLRGNTRIVQYMKFKKKGKEKREFCT